jgi:tetratricopeptide (TPR) repeat protein
MLETIREFAAERLDEVAGEHDEIVHRLALHMAELVENADPQLRQGPDQRLWADRIGVEYDNVRTTMRFALRAAPDLALRIVGCLAFFVWLRGGFAEARGWVDEALASATDAPAAIRGRALVCAAAVAERQGHGDAARAYAEAAYSTYEAAGDRFGICAALRERGKAASLLGHREAAHDIYEELSRLAEEIGDRWNAAVALNNLGDQAMYEGDWERTIELCGRSNALRAELGDVWGAALALSNVAIAQLELGLVDESARSIAVALRDSLSVDAPMVISGGLDISAWLAVARRQWETAAWLFGASARLQEELGSRWEGLERERRDAAERATRDALSDDVFEAEVAHGRALGLQEAVELALSLD